MSRFLPERDRSPVSPVPAWVERELDRAATAGCDVPLARAVVARHATEIAKKLRLGKADEAGALRIESRLAAVVGRAWVERRDERLSIEEVARSLRSFGREGNCDLLAETVLTEAVGQGDPAAVERLLSEYGPVLNRTLRSVGGLRALIELDDLTSRIVERPERYLDGFQAKAPLSTWFARIARSGWRDFLRAETRDDRRLDKLRKLAQETAAPPVFTDSDALRRILTEIFHAAVAALPSRETTLLRMIVIDRLTQAEVAGAIGKDPGTVSRRMGALRTLLKAEVLRRIRESGRETALLESLDEMLADRSLGGLLGDFLRNSDESRA